MILTSCQDGLQEAQPSGEYILLERTVITDAVLVKGDPGLIPVIAVEPSMYIYYDSTSRTLTYRAGERNRLPINSDLKLIFADSHFFLPPLAGAGGGTMWLTPMYFFPHYLDTSLVVIELGDSGLVGIGLSGRPTELLLSPGERFIQVTTHIDTVIQFDGNLALLEFTDSLTIKNWGFHLNSNVILNPL
jgi:hypothetical protein